MNIKNRNIPYGYKFEKGKIIVDDFETSIVKKVFSDYISGLSLLKISNILNDRKIEYLPNQVTWNKNKIKRIIEDKRYLGTEKYPQILESELFNTANNVKLKRDTTKKIKRISYIYNLNIPVVCSECNGQMKRTHHPQLKITEKWICMCCGCSVSILDEDLLNGIKEILNFLMLEPSIISSYSDTDKSIATIKTENEINRILESIDFDRKLIINKIFELASLKYEDLDSDSYMSNKIRAEFDKEKLLTDISLPLLSKTVKEIRLNKDADIRLLLKNNQIIGKEECYGSKSSQIHCTDNNRAISSPKEI